MQSTYNIIKPISHSTKNIITIDAAGVRTNDRLGNNHYRGREQANIKMTAKAFEEVRNFWTTQTINGMAVQINSIRVITAENNMLPSNSYNFRNIIPREDTTNKNNRVAWYNVNFTVGDRTLDTGWVCHQLYRAQYDAIIFAASEVVRDMKLPRYVNRYLLRVLNEAYADQR